VRAAGTESRGVEFRRRAALCVGAAGQNRTARTAPSLDAKSWLQTPTRTQSLVVFRLSSCPNCERADELARIPIQIEGEFYLKNIKRMDLSHRLPLASCPKLGGLGG
jgi:hypothetical protein